MKKRISLFVLMFIVLFTITAPFAYAISTIDANTFREKMENLGYTIEIHDYDSAAANKGNITVEFEKYGSESKAKESIALTCEYIDSLNKNSDEKKDDVMFISSYVSENCTKKTKSSTGYVQFSATSYNEDFYRIAYRKGDTIVSALGRKEDKEEITKIMKELGYHSNNILVIIAIVVIIIGIGIALFIIIKNKNKKTPTNQSQNDIFAAHSD